MPGKYTTEQIYEEAARFRLNIKTIGIKQLKAGVKIEQEHPQANTLTKVMTIVIQHLDEYPDYYTRLVAMEKEAADHWKGKEKPSIFMKRKF
jgi:hypothetical protein